MSKVGFRNVYFGGRNHRLFRGESPPGRYVQDTPQDADVTRFGMVPGDHSFVCGRFLRVQMMVGGHDFVPPVNSGPKLYVVIHNASGGFYLERECGLTKQLDDAYRYHESDLDDFIHARAKEGALEILEVWAAYDRYEGAGSDE